MAHFWKYMQVPYRYESEDGATMEGSKQCTNLLSCTYFFFHEGLGEAGNMKGFLKYANPGTDDYPWRIIFDSVFFVWVGIVLLPGPHYCQQREISLHPCSVWRSGTGGTNRMVAIVDATRADI